MCNDAVITDAQYLPSSLGWDQVEASMRGKLIIAASMKRNKISIETKYNGKRKWKEMNKMEKEPWDKADENVEVDAIGWKWYHDDGNS